MQFFFPNLFSVGVNPYFHTRRSAEGVRVASTWASEVRVRRARDGTSVAHALVLSSLVCCLTHIPSQAVAKVKAKAAAKAKGVGAFTLRDLPTRSSRWASSSTRAKAT